MMGIEGRKIQHIKEQILRHIRATDEVIPDMFILRSHIDKGFENSRLSIQKNEVDLALVELSDDALLDIERASDSAYAEMQYCMTNKGRNFARANFPWEKLNEFA